MGRRTNKVDRHNARSGVKVYETLDQILGYAAIIKCQSGQVLGTCSRDQRDLCGLDGTTWISIWQYLGGAIHPVVRV
jgi:hypothetical protein